MKHKCFAAVVLAAALWLTGCGGAAAPAAPTGPSAAADQSSGAASQSAAAAAVQTAQKERITDQYTLEKNISGVWEEDTGQYISVHVSVHVPQLECDSPDAASINDELNDIYAAHFREYEAYEEAGQPGSEYPQIGVNWDAYWYGDCVSLVMCDRSGGDRPVVLQRLVLRFCHRQADHHSRDAAADGSGPGHRAGSRCSGRPCRPLTGRWCRAHITRAWRLDGEPVANADGHTGIQ